MNRCFLAVLAAALVLIAVAPTQVEARPKTRFFVGQRSYRGTPITQRPNRRGHIVGNTIRMMAR